MVYLWPVCTPGSFPCNTVYCVKFPCITVYCVNGWVTGSGRLVKPAVIPIVGLNLSYLKTCIRRPRMLWRNSGHKWNASAPSRSLLWGHGLSIRQLPLYLFASSGRLRNHTWEFRIYIQVVLLWKFMALFVHWECRKASPYPQWPRLSLDVGGMSAPALRTWTRQLSDLWWSGELYWFLSPAGRCIYSYTLTYPLAHSQLSLTSGQLPHIPILLGEPLILILCLFHIVCIIRKQFLVCQVCITNFKSIPLELNAWTVYLKIYPVWYTECIALHLYLTTFKSGLNNENYLCMIFERHVCVVLVATCFPKTTVYFRCLWWRLVFMYLLVVSEICNFQ